jgi:hypothetical protein
MIEDVRSPVDPRAKTGEELERDEPERPYVGLRRDIIAIVKPAAPALSRTVEPSCSGAL